jgi:hypothetical protein
MDYDDQQKIFYQDMSFSFGLMARNPYKKKKLKPGYLSYRIEQEKRWGSKASIRVKRKGKK